ncbi:hypothetical protein E4T39_08523 [Aureobasidium subglaciale]|nr:hypothetical protein E4T39_08523 [Aureobasidium subglaciale]
MEPPTLGAVYVPASLKDNGRASIFWGGLFALSCAGAYIYGKIQDHIFTQLYALDKGAKDVPKGEKLEFHLRGVRNLDLTGWINSTGPKDTFMAWILSVCSMAGVLYIMVVTGIQVFKNDVVVDKLKQFSENSKTTNDTIFGSSNMHGSYTLESWTCQMKSLVAPSSDITTSKRVTDVLKRSCHDGRKSRYLLFLMLPLTFLMLLTIWKPHWFTFRRESKPTWMAIPLEDDDSEDDDPMAGCGSNAREQWLLEEED